uniref:Uncharacterized protein n=1 Tax=Acrobeloides nanus TaxID=290746 RepID=A0A914DTE3_9BILA
MDFVPALFIQLHKNVPIAVQAAAVYAVLHLHLPLVLMLIQGAPPTGAPPTGAPPTGAPPTGGPTGAPPPAMTT